MTKQGKVERKDEDAVRAVERIYYDWDAALGAKDVEAPSLYMLPTADWSHRSASSEVGRRRCHCRELREFVCPS